MGEGREGDWDAGIGITHSVRSVIDVSSLGFLSTPKLLPIPNGLHRIGDWICTGCSNNNYASREKCGQPKEVAAMPAIAMPRASLQTYSHYFARVHGGPGLKMDIGLTGNAALQQSLPPNSNWPFGGTGWRDGDWICNCGFHNYSSHAQTNRQQQSFQGFEQMAGCSNDQTPGIYAPYPSGSSAKAQNLQAHMQIPHMTRMPTLLGKGAKQWRDGDWMCTNCNNHNFASRSHCNRCKTEKHLVSPSMSRSLKTFGRLEIVVGFTGFCWVVFQFSIILCWLGKVNFLVIP